MNRREFLLGVPASLLVAERAGWPQLLPPLQPSPAVVNPVFRSSLRPWLSLDGEWKLVLDPDEAGFKKGWYTSGEGSLPDGPVHTVNVPGAWEAQGVGEPGLSYATSCEFGRIPLRNEYTGVAWYYKTVTAPAAWKGNRSWLKVGGVNSKGWFWINGKYLGFLHTYTSAAYKFEITPFLKAGENTIIACVNNKLNSRKGNIDWRDQFGGLYRSVELESTSAAYIEDVWAKPDFDGKAAMVNVTVCAPWTKQISGDYRLSIRVHALPDGTPAGEAEAGLQQLAYTGTRAEVSIALNPFHPWSPESPSLYKAEITLLQNGKPIDDWIERFGVRKIERRGPDIYLNGKRYFFRGFGDDYIYPITLSSPPSRDFHRNHLQIAHSYGFNYVRNHTHAENPEYYQAADEVGIMIQPELPYEGIRPSPPGAYQPLDDFNELCRQYRRYISLTTYSMGNEGLHEEQYRRTLFETAKAMDPTRLVMHQDGGVNFEGISDLRGGPINVPVTDHDVEGTMPVILHEYLNLSGPPDPRLAPLYVGGEASSFDLQAIQQQAQKIGLDWDLIGKAIDGGHELQSIYQKLGLENARSVAGLDGYDYWTIADVLALMPQGLLDPFWNQKRSSPEYFRQFNGVSALLLPDLSPLGTDRVLTSGESVTQTVSCSNFGEDAIVANVKWELGGSEGAHAQGELGTVTIPQGNVTTIGKIAFQAPKLARPQELTLRVRIDGRDIENQWKFYCFPSNWPHAKLHDASAAGAPHEKLSAIYPGLKAVSENEAAPPHGAHALLVTTKLDDRALAALGAGGRVLLLSLADLSPEKVGARLGWWWPVNNQRGTAFASSEAFGDFPISGGMPNLSLLRLLHEALPLAGKLENCVDPLCITLGAGPFVIPTVKMPPWSGQDDVSASQSTTYLMNVFQANVGSGRLFASGFDLFTEQPEAKYLMDCFLKYMDSSKFRPKKTIELADLKGYIATRSKAPQTP